MYVEKNEIKLFQPIAEFLPSFRAALAEYHAEGWHLDISADTLLEYISGLSKRAADPEPGRVPETVFWGVVGGEYMGRVSLRHELTAGLEAWGGHIGYEVRPSARGRGYGHALLAGILPYARTLGLQRVLLHCDDSNAASTRVIEAAGAVLEALVVNPDGAAGRRYWLEL
jgi:predicted acetyltransferase